MVTTVRFAILPPCSAGKPIAAGTRFLIYLTGVTAGGDGGNNNNKPPLAQSKIASVAAPLWGCNNFPSETPQLSGKTVGRRWGVVAFLGWGTPGPNPNQALLYCHRHENPPSFI
jgi:hypothetical protein